MKKLRASRKAPWADNFLTETILWAEVEHHITNKKLTDVQRIERKAGIKKPEDYDVPSDRPDGGRGRSGLF